MVLTVVEKNRQITHGQYVKNAVRQDSRKDGTMTQSRNVREVYPAIAHTIPVIEGTGRPCLPTLAWAS